MLFRITLGALIAAVLFGVVQTKRLDWYREGEALTAIQLDACGIRLTNILEAQESNAGIPDNLGDFPVPSDWMLPTAD